MTTEAVPGKERSPAAVGVFALVLVGLVGFLPSSARSPLTLLIVVVLAGVAVGLPSAIRLARRGDVVARLGLGFGAWAVVSAAASAEPLAWSGEYFSATGAVFTVGLVAFWAVGRSLPGDAIPAVVAGFVTGALVNAAVAVAQGPFDLSAADLYLFDERSTGLLGNPVFLGAACAAAVALLPIVARWSWPAAAVTAAALAAAVQMSGTRNSVIVLVGAGGWAAVRCGRRVGPVLAVALLLGLGAGAGLQADAGATAAARFDAESGVGSRVENWRDGLEAAVDRPLTGYGPGRWRAATSSRRGLELARAGPDQLYADAHNLPMEYLATTGFVGAGLLVAWLAAGAWSLRRAARPDLAAAALALLVFHAVQPQHMTLTPLMLLLAGAAAGRAEGRAVRARAWSVVQVGLVAVALVVAGRVVLGDLRFRTADLDFDAKAMHGAGDLLWPWPNPVVEESRIHAFEARTTKVRGPLLDALADARRARRLEPENPLRSIAVASVLAQLDRHQEAAAEFSRALEHNPWSRQALLGRAEIMRALGRTAQATACRTATQLSTRTDSELRAARSRCLGADAERERP